MNKHVKFEYAYQNITAEKFTNSPLTEKQEMALLAFEKALEAKAKHMRRVDPAINTKMVCEAAEYTNNQSNMKTWLKSLAQSGYIGSYEVCAGRGYRVHWCTLETAQNMLKTTPKACWVRDYDQD